MIAVDSSVWVGLLRDHSSPAVDWLVQNSGSNDLSIPDVGIHEVLRGSRDAGEFERTRKYLRQIPVLDTGGRALAEDAAERYTWLRRRGITIRSTADCVIAALCLRDDHVLLHQDRDFEPFERYFGLLVVRD